MPIRLPISSGSIGCAADALHGYPLGGEHFMLQGVHRPGALVNRARKGEGPSQKGRQPCLVLYASLGIFMCPDQEVLLRLDAEQLPCGELMVQPIYRSILQIRERIMARRAGQLVFAKDSLLLPGILLLNGIRARPVPVPVPALHRLATVAPC